MYVVVRRVTTLIVALAVAGCGGTNSSSPSVGTSKSTASGAAAAVSLALASTPTTGTKAVIPLTVTALNSAGKTITGAYQTGIVVSSTDTTDLAFSLSATGSPASSTLTITNSSQLPYLVYDGNALPAGTALLGTTPTAAAQSLSLAAAAGASASAAPSSAPVIQTSYLAGIYVTGSGASPVNTGGGAIPIYIIAQDQNGNDITGTYPSPISVSLTNACGESLSVNGSGTVEDCEVTNPTSNVAAITVTSAGQVVFVNYVGRVATSPGASSDISVSTSSVIAGPSPAPGATAAPVKISIFCDAITFPYNVTESCEPNAEPTPGPAQSPPY